MLLWVAVSLLALQCAAVAVGLTVYVKKIRGADNKAAQPRSPVLDSDGCAKCIQMERRVKGLELEWSDFFEKATHKMAQIDGRKGGRRKKEEPETEEVQPLTREQRLAQLRAGGLHAARG